MSALCLLQNFTRTFVSVDHGFQTIYENLLHSSIESDITNSDVGPIDFREDDKNPEDSSCKIVTADKGINIEDAKRVSTDIKQRKELTLKLGETSYATTGQHSKEHIMISYCHKQKDLAHKTVRRLRGSGFQNLWIDSENMHKGPGILDEMVDAIDNASVIICLLSQDYYLSENCMCEIRYARTQKKAIIPVIVQARFTPEKVLLMCISDKYRFDLSTDAQFALSYPLLEEKLRAEKLL